MKEVAMLVQEQGEQIDSILANVGEAKDYVVKAEKVLVKEKEEHKKSRKVTINPCVETLLHYLFVAGRPGPDPHAHHHQGCSEQKCIICMVTLSLS